MSKIVDYIKLVKFQHTIFAMPFAMISFVYTWWHYLAPAEAQGIATGHSLWLTLLQVVLCMVFARNTAMGFNRWADRDIDAANRRTANREIPAGVITPREALRFVGINALLFVGCAISINPLAGWLSPIALCVLLGYSYCKRFTWLAHLVLGLALGIAPVGVAIALVGRITPESCLLALLVMTWCGGFDIIYALQDYEFDTTHGLHSIPQRFKPRGALAISLGLHILTIAALIGFCSYCPQGIALWLGEALFIALLCAEHLLVTPTRQRNIGIVFGTLNGLASLTLSLFLIVQMLLAR
jgi:4-hydroxybenzoate polyprenyltransferase